MIFNYIRVKSKYSSNSKHYISPLCMGAIHGIRACFSSKSCDFPSGCGRNRLHPNAVYLCVTNYDTINCKDAIFRIRQADGSHDQFFHG